MIARDSGKRLDVFLAELENISRNYSQKIISQGLINVNGKPAKSSYKIESGDIISGSIPDPEPIPIEPEHIPLDIVYEDSDILVVDKPAGLVVHPAPGNWKHTMVNALLAHCPDFAGIGGKLRPGIVHRLDKNTSGLMVIAKNDKAQQDLSLQIKMRQVKKRYLALLVGRLGPRTGAIEASLGRDPANRKKMAVVNSGREARTGYRVIRYIDGYTYVEVTPLTGRTHQIRVHFASIGFPVFADEVYGRRSKILNRHFLHANILGFRLPGSDEYREFKSDLPNDLEQLLGKLDQGEES